MKTFERLYKDLGFKVLLSDSEQYASIHYTIKTQPDELYFEIQVRTLAEESYAQVEHEVRYKSKLININEENLFKINNLLTGLSNQASALNCIVNTVYDLLEKDKKIKENELMIARYKDKDKNSIKVEIPNTEAYFNKFTELFSTYETIDYVRLLKRAIEQKQKKLPPSSDD